MVALVEEEVVVITLVQLEQVILLLYLQHKGLMAVLMLVVLVLQITKAVEVVEHWLLDNRCKVQLVVMVELVVD
tara:strand:+ start:430 stop:651 length:222 start_codon:yes stop_codon:yes gene_type:complete